MKTMEDYLNYSTVILIIIIALFLPSCAGKQIYKNDLVALSVIESHKVATRSHMAKVEYSFLKENRKDYESVRIDCQAWEITIYNRISYKSGRIASMGNWYVNNEFKIEGNTLGSVLFQHFCVDK